MNEKDLLAAILAKPADDQPRFDYANWCEAHDPARAELIRVQCQMEVLALDDPTRDKLNARAYRLTKANEQRWLMPVKGLTFFAHFKRGFPENVGIKVEQFASIIEPLYAITPISAIALCCLDIKDHLPTIVASPYLANVRSLSLNNLQLDDEKMKLIADCAYLKNLQSLDIGANPLTPRGIETLAQTSNLANLRSLSLPNITLGVDGATALAASKYLTNLNSLNLFCTSIGPDGAAALANSPALSNLKSLLLSAAKNSDNYNKPIEAAGAIALANSKYLTSLESLILSDNWLKDEGTIAIAESQNLASLIDLQLNSNFITKDGGAALAAAAQFTKLRSLDLCYNALSEAGTAAFAQSPLLTHLKRLGLTSNGVYHEPYYIDYTDWDGSIVGGGNVADSFSAAELQQKFNFPASVAIF